MYILQLLCFVLVRHPEMIIPLKNVTILPNQDFDLNCLASSSGVLTYNWKKQDGNLPQTAVESYIHTVFFNSLTNETTVGYNLKVQNAQPLDEGWYCCVAANEAGSTTECAWLEINS